MNEKVEHNVFINIPKPRVYSKIPVHISKKSRSTEKKIKKPSDASFSKYTSYNNESLAIQTIKKEESLLPYKYYAKRHGRKNHELRLAVNIYDKYKVAYTELRKRLHVEDLKDDIHAITDIDKDFYMCVEIEKKSKYAPLYKSIKTHFNQYISLRQKIGYINDCILNIEVLQRKEKETYDYSVNKYMEQAKYLDDFISSDYKKSIECLNDCKMLAQEVNKKEIELQRLANEKFTIVSRLINLDFLYGVQQKYGRFLYYLSPPSWRSMHRDFARSMEIEARGFDFSCSNEEDTFNVIFEKMKNECYYCLLKPVLYFKDPSDLMYVFDGIEKQESYHFAHITSVELCTKNLRKIINILKQKTEIENAGTRNVIAYLETNLQFHEERSAYLEDKFFKILYETFYASIAATDVLKLNLHLEFVYQKIYSKKPLKNDILATVKVLETMYMDYSKKLDGESNKKVKEALVRHLNVERKKMKRAKIAARELQVLNRLERNLLRAHSLSDSTPNKKEQKVRKSFHLHKQSTCFFKEKTDDCYKRYLTEEEKEYLVLFTDWNENDDPANYLQSFEST